MEPDGYFPYSRANQPLVPVLGQMNLIHTLILPFFKAHLNTILPFCLRFPGGLIR
jgi:hypothetical protein